MSTISETEAKKLVSDITMPETDKVVCQRCGGNHSIYIRDPKNLQLIYVCKRCFYSFLKE